jgi:hypothetical protein
MKTYTDSQRLHFMYSKQPDLDNDGTKFWVVYHRQVKGVARKVVSFGKDYSDAIDNALNGVYGVAD